MASNDEVKSKPPPQDETSDKITVVSWNIHRNNLEHPPVIDPTREVYDRVLVNAGSTGSNVAHHAMVREALKNLNPHVLLLQDLPRKKIIDDIIAAGTSNNRVYRKVPPPNETEAEIIYDDNRFNVVERINSNGEKTTMENILRGALKSSATPPAHDDDKETNEIMQRIQCVCLEDKKLKRCTIFLSFNNKKESEKTVCRAEVVCRAAAEIKKMTDIEVVVGADFKCNIECKGNIGAIKGINIMPYKRPHRHQSKVDFFVVTQQVVGSAKAHDLLRDGGEAENLNEKGIQTKNREVCVFTYENDKCVLNHVPLVLTMDPVTIQSYQPPPASDCGTIKVLSWNIYGNGMSEIRKEVVLSIVEKIDPDVLLLQEKYICEIVELTGDVNSSTKRRYISVESAKDTESRVIYDSEKYQLITEEEKVFGGKSLEEVFDESIQVFPSYDGSTTRSATRKQAETGKPPQPLEEVVKERTSYICLEIKGSDPVRRIVFMSYHNLNNSQGAAESRMAAIEFCKMMKKMQQLTGVTVVAGADLNRTMEHMDTYQEIPEEEKEATMAEVKEVIVPYDPVQYDNIVRRKRKIDYIMASPTTDCVTNVRALDFVRAKDKPENPLHEVITNLMDKFETHTTVTYNRALDHDPIVCDIRIFPPPPKLPKPFPNPEPAPAPANPDPTKNNNSDYFNKAIHRPC